MFFFDGDVVEQYGGGFKWKIVVSHHHHGNKVDNLLGELPVFNGIWTCDELMFRSLDFVFAEMAEGIIWVFSLIHKLLERPVGPLGDVQVERLDLWLHI